MGAIATALHGPFRDRGRETSDPPPHVFRVLGLKLRHAPMSVGVCLQICMCTMCLQHLRKPEEDAGTIAIGITGSSEGHVGARD